MVATRLHVFDADGTLRQGTGPGRRDQARPGEWELLPGVKGRLARVDWGVTGFGILSNQSDIARGRLTVESAHEMLAELAVAATGRRPQPGAIFICPHAPTAGCACRKPSPLGLLSLMALFGATPAETLFVGDLETDRECALRAGVDFALAADFFGSGRVTPGAEAPAPAHNLSAARASLLRRAASNRRDRR